MPKTKINITVSDRVPEIRPLVEQTALTGMPTEADVIYNGRNTLFVLDGRQWGVNAPVNVKAFHQPRFPNDIIYVSFRDSKARRSYLHARKLLDMGFLTPEPYAYGEVLNTGGSGRILPKLTSSYYFCRHLPYPDLRGWEVRPDYTEFVAALGREMARLHKAGIWMKDFSTGNILHHKDAEGNFHFYYVDLNRMEFGVKSTGKLMQMFRSLSPERRYVLDIAAAYAEAAGKDPDAVKKEAGKIFDSFIKGKQTLNKLKSLSGKKK